MAAKEARDALLGRGAAASRVFFKKMSDEERAASDAYDESGQLEESLRQIHARYGISDEENDASGGGNVKLSNRTDWL